MFWVVGLERGPLSLVRIIVELLEWKSGSSRSRKPRLTAVGISCADYALTSPSSSGRSVGIVCLRTKIMEFSFIFKTVLIYWTRGRISSVRWCTMFYLVSSSR
jgi:hypothetical protein